MVLLLKESDIETLVDMKSTVTCMEAAFREQSEGRTLLPDRQVIQEAGSDAVVRIMAASVPTLQALGLKTLLGVPAKRKKNSTYFLMLLFDPCDASLSAVISAGRLTQLRTGGASAVATKYLARKSSATIGLVGAGVQGYGQLEGVASVTSLVDSLIFDIDEAKANALIEKAKSKLNLKVRRVSRLEDLYGVDVLCTATTSVKPVIYGDMLRSGTHINAVGSNVPSRQEIHESVLLKSRVFVDRKKQALNESGDFLLPIQRGEYSPEDIRGELCDVVTGKIDGRTSDMEITLFKSVGIALEDVALAKMVYDIAVGKGLGQGISF